ncbi:MAG TPA: ATP-binding protein [Acidimicrobiales bacterium]|nr:ATP-binding protein [Acidimicrobiales bacterium]
MPTTRASGEHTPVILPLAPADARRELRILLAGTRWCPQVDSVVLAVHEALVNADRHGGGAVRLDVCIHGDALVIEVCDRGPGFEFPTPADQVVTETSDPFSEHGRGVWLICQIASRAETDRRGDNFCLRMQFDPPGGRTRR